jgi:hypothetical protein
MTSLNIVELIEKNPVARLSSNYHSKLLTKIKEEFTEEEQQMFVASFYCYLNYDSKKDFVIDLDNVWKWLGFTQKHKAKYLLETNFTLDVDYKSLLNFAVEQRIYPESTETKSGRGGHNKIKIMITINAFKRLCLKACTKKADKIHDYYIKLEDVLQGIINEESNELRIQLENKDKMLENLNKNTVKEKELLREKTILEQFPDNNQCVYYGVIDNISIDGEPLIKFGNSNFLRDRVNKHKKTYTNFRLVKAFRVENKTQIENALKKHEQLSKYKRTITINNKTHTELLAIRNDLTLENLDKIIKSIILSIEYSVDNYKKLLLENDRMNKLIMSLSTEVENLKTQKSLICDISNNVNINKDNKELLMKSMLLEEENEKLKIDNKNTIKRALLLEEENTKLKAENIKFIKKYKLDKQFVESHIEETNHNVSDTQYNIITNNMKRITKSADGFYYIDGNKYNKCFGTRPQVWNGDAYKTSGGLTKNDLIMNKHSEIVSKSKFLYEKTCNRLPNNPKN